MLRSTTRVHPGLPPHDCLGSVVDVVETVVGASVVGAVVGVTVVGATVVGTVVGVTVVGATVEDKPGGPRGPIGPGGP